jgi:hypothetical protein
VAQSVHVTWPASGIAPDIQLSLQRADDGDDLWTRVQNWTAASAGQVDDPHAISGATYQYRLKARNGAGRLSHDEPVIGPLHIP